MNKLKEKLNEFAYKAPNKKIHFLVNETEMKEILEIACVETAINFGEYIASNLKYSKSERPSWHMSNWYNDWFNNLVKDAFNIP